MNHMSRIKRAAFHLQHSPKQEIGRPGRGRRGGRRRGINSRDLEGHVRVAGKDINAESFSRDFAEDLISSEIHDDYASNDQAETTETNEHVIADPVGTLRDGSGKANEDDSSVVFAELNGNDHFPDEESSIEAELREMRTQMVLFRERELSLQSKLDTVRQRGHMQQKEESLRSDYETAIREKDDEIERYKIRLQGVEKNFQDLCTVLERKDAESAQHEGELTRRLEEYRVRESQSNQVIQDLQGQVERMREAQAFSANVPVYNSPGFHSSGTNYMHSWTQSSAAQHNNGEILTSDRIAYEWEHAPRPEEGSDSNNRTNISIGTLSQHYNPPFSQENVVGHQNSNFANDISRFFGAKAVQSSHAVSDYRYSYASDAETGGQFQNREQQQQQQQQWDNDNQTNGLIQAGNHVMYGRRDNASHAIGNGMPDADVSRQNGASEDMINSQSHGEATSVFVTPLAQSQN